MKAKKKPAKRRKKFASLKQWSEGVYVAMFGNQMKESDFRPATEWLLTIVGGMAGIEGMSFDEMGERLLLGMRSGGALMRAMRKAN